MGKQGAKITTLGSSFGNDVDYFLFSIRAKSTIFSIADYLADYCGCRFNMMPLLKIPESKVCKMLPEFRMLYAQYAPPVMDTTFAQDPVDRLNIVIFQNRAVAFDKSKSGLSRESYNGAFSFIDDECFCHAFSPDGIRIHKCASADFADYYLMVFAKKNKNADKLAERIASIKDLTIKDLTDELFNEKPSNENIPNFFRAIFAMAENQIRQLMRSWEKDYVGNMPKSMTPVDIRNILRQLSLSNPEVTINNL